MSDAAPPLAAAQLSDNYRGAAYMTAAMLGFAVNDVITKAFTSQMAIGQFLLLRGLFAIALVYLLAHFLRHTRSLRFMMQPLIALRALGEVIATYCFITALYHLPLANVSSVMQALPLALTLAAAILFGEKVGWRRLTAIAIGFLGVLVIVRPGLEGFSIYSLYVIGSVFGCVIRDLATRRLKADVPSLMVTLVTAIAVTSMGGVLALFGEWTPVTGGHLVWLAAGSVFLLIGYFFAVTAMRVGELGFVSPFRYSVLLFSIIGGALVFSEYPDWMTLLGAFIVVATGVYTLYRERMVHRQAIVPAPAQG